MTRGEGHRQFWLAVTCCAAALMAAACSNGAGASVRTSSVLSESAAATANSRSAKITTTVTGRGAPSNTERMVYDFIRHRGEVLPWSGPDGSSGSEVIIDGSTMYEDETGGYGFAVDLHGKRWLKVSDGNSIGNAFGSAPSANMATLMTELAPIVNAVHHDGTASIGGVATTKYILTLSTAKIRSLTRYQDDTESYGPVMLWIDSQERIRQIQFSDSIPQFGKMTVKSDYTDFGIPVHVSVPPASEVMTEQQYENDLCAATSSSSSGSQAGQATFFANGTSSPAQSCSSIGTTTP